MLVLGMTCILYWPGFPEASYNNFMASINSHNTWVWEYMKGVMKQ